jgi:tetratricopeptide (TPR) repeat protein
MKRAPFALAVVAAALLAAPRPALADLKSADAKLLHGDYPAAIKDYRAVKGKDFGRTQVHLGYALVRTGDYVGAEKVARDTSKSKDTVLAADASVLLAEILRATGRYADARTILEATVKARPTHLRARVQLGLTYLDLGEKDLAAAIFQQFYDDWSADKIDQNNAEQLMYVAIAARFSEGYEDANDTFRDAVDKDPNLLEANVQWGWLFLEKYAAGYAEQSFDEVLKIDANHPDALVGLARVKLEQNYDVKSATDLIQRALAQNPKHVGALSLRAELEIDNAQYEDARKTLALVFAVNPNDVDAHTLVATTYWMRDDQAGYEAERKKVFAVNPKDARFYHMVSDFAVKEHRYKEAIALEEEALKVDPKYHLALAGIGTGYLRLGEEQKGLEYLNKAWERDSFNARTYNILNLFDDVIPKDYVFAVSKHFKFRMQKDEKAMLERYVPRTLEKAFDDMAKRYGFVPRIPTIVELYTDPDHYSVRTVGLPNLGALGVCFGSVITAMSPSSGNLNWGMVLWHELGHVFAIQLSNSRVPRWFTEGLSEYETILARKEWRRENDADVWAALAAGKLPSVLELNTQFLRARDMGEMTVAYHMSSLAIEFIGTRWGFPKIVDALKLYAKGKTDAQVIQAVTGLDAAGFDAEFKKHLEKRFAPYAGTFKIVMAGYDDVVALEKAAAAAPGDADALASVALGYLGNQNADKADAAAQKALSIDGKNKKALWVRSELAFVTGSDPVETKKRLEALIAAGGDGYDARIRLGILATRAGDLKEAETQLNLAKKLDPERSEPYSILAEQYFKANRDDDALRELEAYVYIEQMEYPPLAKLVQKYSARKNWAKVKEFGEMALNVNPWDSELHLALGEAYLQLKQLDGAAYEFESALFAQPPLPRPAVAQIALARAQVARKDLKAAKKAIDAALKLEPRNAEALELKKKVK